MMKLSYESVFWALALPFLIQAHAPSQHETLDILPRQDATSSVPRPSLGSLPYGTAIFNCANPGTVALTYDDGPGDYTAELLDLLAKNNIKATFFILGNRNGSMPIDQKYPDLIKRMYREGHQLASHTWDHASLEALSSAQRIAEMTKTEAAFKNILGFFPTYMRPPYGFCYAQSGCLSDMGKLGYHVIDWSVDTKDYENDSPTLIQNAKNLWDAAFNSGNPQSSSFIPLTHDIHQNTVENLAPYMIQEIKAKGYKFATVGECLNDPAQNWYRNATTGQTANKVVAQGAAGASSSSSSASSASVSSATSSRAVNASSPSTATSTHASTVSSAHASISPSTTTQSTSSSGIQLTVNLFLCSMLAMLYVMVHS